LAGLKVQTLRDAVLTGFRSGPTLFQIKLLCSPAIVNTILVTEQSITVTGLAAGDIALAANKPTINNAIGLAGTGRIGANAWFATFVNPTAGNVTPTAAEVYDLVVMRPAS